MSIAEFLHGLNNTIQTTSSFLTSPLKETYQQSSACILSGLKNEMQGYPDLVVQAACAALTSATSGHVSAIRRPCTNEAPSCDVICRGATSQMKAKSGSRGDYQLSKNKSTL